MIHVTNPLPAQRARFNEKNRRPCVLYKNIFSGNLATPGAGVSGFPQINLTDGKTNTSWRGLGSAPLTVATVTDLPEQDVDCIGIAAHTLGTQNATIKVQGYVSGAWVDICDPVSPADNGTLLVVFPTVAVTGLRLRVLSFDSHPDIGVLFGGLRLVFNTEIVLPYSPLHLSEDIETLTNQSGNGNYIGARVKRRGLVGRIPLAITEYRWVLEHMGDFQRTYNDSGSFFFASSPIDLMQDVLYCWRDGEAMRPQFVAGRHQVRFTLDVRGYHAG